MRIKKKKPEEYSDNRNAEYFRRFYQRLKSHIDVRVCWACRYAFISRGGWNVCGPCLAEWVIRDHRPDDTALTRYSARTIVKARKNKEMWTVTRITARPRYKVPDIDSPLARIAINDAFERLKERASGVKNGCLKMPRIESLGPYPLIDVARVGAPKIGESRYARRSSVPPVR